MYRMNPYTRTTPRDRLDPHMPDRHMVHNRMENRRGCGCDAEGYEQPKTRSSCSACNNEHTVHIAENTGCGCATEEVHTDFNYSLAMVYSPHQEWQNLYCEEEGLMAGTIFKELDKPFYGPKCHGGNYHE